MLPIVVETIDVNAHSFTIGPDVENVVNVVEVEEVEDDEKVENVADVADVADIADVADVECKNEFSDLSQVRIRQVVLVTRLSMHIT